MYYNCDEWERRSIETEIKNKATKEVLEQGIEQVREQNVKEIIKNMFANNMDLEIISKVTNKSIEEIKKY